jgi:pilus assembly protein Flp/PilA
MRLPFVRFVKDQSGATAVEYGLILAGIAVAILAALSLIGTNIAGIFNSVANDLKPAG